jgi:septal ring factor EnvC (AmiA/AmiB activator)
MRKIVVYIVMLIAVSATAQTNTKIKGLEEQRKRTQAEIVETQQLLSENKRTTSNALNRLSLLKKQVASRREVIGILNVEIEEADKGIKTTEANIRLLEKELKAKKGVYAESVRKMYLNQNEQNKLLFIFSADNFFQSYRRIRYLKEFAKWERRQAEDVIRKQEQLTEEKEKLIRGKAEKLDLLQNKEEEEKKLVVEENTQSAEVKELQSERRQLNVELEKQKKQALALNRAIEKAISDEIARAEREAKAAAAKALAEKTPEKPKTKSKNNKGTTTPPKTEETAVVRPRGGLEVTKEDRILTGNFLSNRGKLPYPLKGNYKIVSEFGEHRDPELKKVIRNNNGIDLQTVSGNKALSVFGGEVTTVFVIPGKEESRGVIVRHGNYLTAYCNLVDLSVKKGDKVSTGQTLGTIYTDDGSTILHFEIREETKKMNPLNWLR